MIKLVVFTLCILTSLSAPRSWASANSSLTFYFYKSPKPLDWSSPGALTSSTIKSVAKDELNGRDRIALGHVSVEVTCANGTSFHSAMTQAKLTESPALLLGKQAGLGVLFHRFKGRLETQKEIWDRFRKDYIQVNFVSFKISESSCDRLKEYYEVFQEENLDQYYGMMLDPLKKEGAGCQSYASSFLELIGFNGHASHEELYGEVSTHWTMLIRVPERHVGYPLLPEQKVSLAKLLTRKTSWELRSGEKGFHLQFMDPNSVYEWVNRKLSSSLKKDGMKVVRKTISGKGVRGFEFDLTDIPTPTGPIFK